jgi:putative ABC transport system permease protein
VASGQVLGLGVSLVAAYFPARWGSRVQPLEGLTGDGSAQGERRRRWPAYLGVAFVAVAILMDVALTAGWIPLSSTAPAMALLAAGLVMAIPLALPPLSWLAGRLLAPLLGTEGRLAFRQLDRHPTRTSLTVGVLFVAVIVAISTGSSLLNNVRDTSDWYERTIVGDYFVRGSMPDLGTNSAPALPEDLAARLAAAEGVEAVDKFRFIPGRTDERDVIVLARTLDPAAPLALDLEEGEPEEVIAGLLRGETVVGTALAQRQDLEIGGTVTLQTRQGPRELRIAGTTTEYSGGGSALYLDWDTARELLDFEGVDVFLVHVADGQEAVAGASLEELSRQEGFMLQSLQEFKDFLDEMIAGIVGFVWLILALLFVVASLGIVNTLTMNVLEQTRELGLLRAVAMTRRQIRKLILAQALAVAAISLIPGLVAGVAIAFLLNRATYPVLGHPVDFRVDPLLLVGTLVVALVISLAAAWLPAGRAARLQVIEALKYE